MNLQEWAARWNIPMGALVELRSGFGMDPRIIPEVEGFSETAVQSRQRLEAAAKGVHLWRNNMGACTDETGRLVRYGLMNDSAKLNKEIKSSDLIGIREFIIEQRHVGYKVGQFVARECKPAGWVYTGTEREQAQLAFLRLVASMGGDAAFSSGAPTL